MNLDEIRQEYPELAHYIPSEAHLAKKRKDPLIISLLQQLASGLIEYQTALDSHEYKSAVHLGRMQEVNILIETPTSKIKSIHQSIINRVEALEDQASTKLYNRISLGLSIIATIVSIAAFFRD